MPRVAPTITVSDEDRSVLRRWARGRRTPARLVRRAKIVLRAADGRATVLAVWPETQEQRDWCHKMGNVLDKLPKRLQPKAKRALREIMYAETRREAANRRLHRRRIQTLPPRIDPRCSQGSNNAPL